MSEETKPDIPADNRLLAALPSGEYQELLSKFERIPLNYGENIYEVGDTIRPSEIKPGDLIFFNTTRNGDGASHVAIAVGPDSFVHAPTSSGVVRIETLGSAYWGARYVGARRISPSSLTVTR